jgi:hypothetical protein
VSVDEIDACFVSQRRVRETISDKTVLKKTFGKEKGEGEQ